MILKINDRIRTRKVDYFNQFRVSLRYDSVASSFGFNFFFNPDNTEHKEMACIGHYHIATLEHNNELLLTGYILSTGFDNSAVKKMATFGGYSLPGPLEDCQIPPSLYPLQSDGLSLKEIAERLVKPFGLKIIVDSAVSARMESTYEKTTAGVGQTIKDYLTELATQKNIILSHTSKGELLFTEAKTSRKPILHYGGDGLPCPEMKLDFNGQAMHSEITVIKQADKDGGNAGQITVKNPYVPYVYRPKVVAQSSGDDIDTEQAAKNLLAAELKNLKLTITTDRWEIDGKIVKPNNLISVINPEVYLYKKTEWFIEQVDLVGDNTKTTATLTCVPPEVYNGKTPSYTFKGINTH